MHIVIYNLLIVLTNVKYSCETQCRRCNTWFVCRFPASPHIKVEPGLPSVDGVSTIYDDGRLSSPATMDGGRAVMKTNALTNNNNNNSNNINNNNSAIVKQCAGCGVKIVDRFLLHALERYWHTGCLKCSCCQAHLGEIGTSCFTKAGMILCKNDYIRWVMSRVERLSCG